MVGINGLGGVPEPKPDRPSKVRGERDGQAGGAAAANAGASSSGDDVRISSEAHAAAEVARIVSLTESQSEIRAERVAEAKAAIERGDYKKPEVVAEVAKRVSKYLP